MKLLTETYSAKQATFSRTFLSFFGISVVCRARVLEETLIFSHFSPCHRPAHHVIFESFDPAPALRGFQVASASHLAFFTNSLWSEHHRVAFSEFQRFTEQRSNLLFSFSLSIFLFANIQRKYFLVIAVLSDFKYKCRTATIISQLLFFRVI